MILYTNDDLDLVAWNLIDLHRKINDKILAIVPDERTKDDLIHEIIDIYQLENPQAAYVIPFLIYVLDDGAKIRSLRASNIVVVNYGQMPKEEVNIVVRGFFATEVDPLSKIKEQARRKRLQGK